MCALNNKFYWYQLQPFATAFPINGDNSVRQGPTKTFRPPSAAVPKNSGFPDLRPPKEFKVSHILLQDGSVNIRLYYFTF